MGATKTDTPGYVCTGHIHAGIVGATSSAQAARIFHVATGFLPEIVAKAEGGEFWIAPKFCPCGNVHFLERPRGAPGEHRSHANPVVDCGGCATTPNPTQDRLLALLELSKRIETLVEQLPGNWEPVGVATVDLFQRTCYNLASAFISAQSPARLDLAGHTLLEARVQAWNDNIPKGTPVVVVRADGTTAQTETSSTAWANDNGVALVGIVGDTPARIDHVTPCVAESSGVAS